MRKNELTLLILLLVVYAKGFITGFAMGWATRDPVELVLNWWRARGK